MKRFTILLLIAIGFYCVYLDQHDERDLPALHDGDIVFQTTWTNQSIAIGIASASIYIHTGIVEKTPQGFSVIEAGPHVRETPLSRWIRGGILQRFSVYRYSGLTPQQASDVIKAASSHDGEPYDMYFSFTKGSMYCSELVYLAFKDAGVPLGKLEKIGELNINNRFTREIIEQRWHNYPTCRDANTSFEQCYSRIMNGDIITPAALAHDPHLVRIFDNYPW